MVKEKRDSIIFYRSFYEAINEMPLEMQGKIYSAIFEYSLNFNEVILEGLPKAIFTLIKPQLDANNKRFENGKKGGVHNQNRTKTEPKPNQNRTKTEPKPNQNRTKTEPNVNDNVNDNDNENENILLEKESKDKKFSFSKSLIDFGFDKKLVEHFLKVREKKKLVNTEVAFNRFINEIKATKKPPDKIFEIIITKQWGGFEAKWLENVDKNHFQQTEETAQPTRKKL